MPKAAAIGANQDREALGDLLVVATRYGAIVLIATSLPLVIGAKWFLTLWLGVSYADKIALLLQLMVIANCIRYLGSPYATIAMAIGAQKQIILAPIVEGLVNITISIIFTAQYGLIGVVIGTLCGAFVTVGIHYLYNLPRTEQIRVRDKKMLIYAVVRPFIAVLPAFLLWSIYRQYNLSQLMEFICLVGSASISYALILKYAIFNTERANLMGFIKSKLMILKKH
jgi:O-antigen/teichoic acid export membrane protein